MLPLDEELSVIVADDHPLFRDGVARGLTAAGLSVVGEAATGQEALALIRERCPAVALVDYRLPPPDGIELAAIVAGEELSTRVVILSAYSDRDLVYKALEAGAAGFLVKLALREEIAAAVRLCAAGETVLSPSLTSGVAAEIRERRKLRDAALSERERTILELMADGRSVPEIGRQLYLSTSTVKNNVQHLYEKLGVGDRAAAVAEGMRRGLIS